MANTVSGLTQYFIQGAIQAFASTVAPLRAFSNVIEMNGAGLGDIVRVPFISNTSGSQDFTYAGGYTLTSGNSVAGKSVTLNMLKYQNFDVTDSDILKLSPEVLTAMGNSAGGRLGSDVLSASFAALMPSFSTTATYTAGQFTSSVALIDLDKKANDANWTTANRSLIINPTIKQNMLLNANLANAYAFNGNVANTAQFPQVFGMTPYVVTSTIGGSSGFVANPNAILMAMAWHKPGTDSPHVEYQPIVDKATGLMFGFKSYYDFQYARTVRVIECLFGVAAGDTTALVKIT
jgi:hypothetical protein